MSHKKRRSRRAAKAVPTGERPETGDQPAGAEPVKLEIVLKSDTVGTLEAVTKALGDIFAEGVDVRLIHSGVGAVTKSDLLMALTGSRLVLGFDVDVLPRVDAFAREQGVEVRLYAVIYHLVRDVEEIARSLVPKTAKEKITGRAKVIALFKSSRKGIILGCEVLEGQIALGKRFRVITAMGPAYVGVVESLKKGANFAKSARLGQQFGLKIRDFKDAKVGDQVECFEDIAPRCGDRWIPRGGMSRIGE